MPKVPNLIINGASCTGDSPWWTWADLVRARYEVRVSNHGRKGLGNEAIITRAVAEALDTIDPIIVVMLTAVDKWDWYTTDSHVIEQVSREKHSGYSINGEQDGLYWSTGSHFPLWKEHYGKHYADTRQMLMNTIKHIDWFVKTCRAKGWPFLLLSDYKIFSYTEREANLDYDAVKHRSDTRLIDRVSKPFFDEIRQHVDHKGLFEVSSGEIRHSRFGLHPGTHTHWLYCRDRVFPFLDRHCAVANRDLEHLVQREQKLWEDSQT